MKALDMVSRCEFVVIGRKTTVCLLTLETGFEIVGTSAPVDVEAFDKKIGEEWAYKDALNELDKFWGFYIQMKQFEADRDFKMNHNLEDSERLL